MAPLPSTPLCAVVAMLHHLMLYPPAHAKIPTTARLRTAQGSSSSMTDQTHRQPSGGACFITAMYPNEFVTYTR